MNRTARSQQPPIGDNTTKEVKGGLKLGDFYPQENEDSEQLSTPYEEDDSEKEGLQLVENYKGPLMTNGGAKSQRFANLYNAVDLESTQKGEDTVGKVDFQINLKSDTKNSSKQTSQRRDSKATTPQALPSVTGDNRSYIQAFPHGDNLTEQQNNFHSAGSSTIRLEDGDSHQDPNYSPEKKDSLYLPAEGDTSTTHILAKQIRFGDGFAEKSKEVALQGEGVTKASGRKQIKNGVKKNSSDKLPSEVSHPDTEVKMVSRLECVIGAVKAILITCGLGKQEDEQEEEDEENDKSLIIRVIPKKTELTKSIFLRSLAKISRLYHRQEEQDNDEASQEETPRTLQRAVTTQLKKNANSVILQQLKFNYSKIVKGNIEKPYMLKLFTVKENGQQEDNLLRDTVIVNIGGKPRTFAKKSLFFFGMHNFFRRSCLSVVENRYFEWFILVVILLNSIQLALFDYTDRTSESLNNKLLDKVDAVFTAIYAMEAALKIFSYGFFLHKNSYLRDFWNDIDFIVAFTGVIELISRDTSHSDLRWIRTVRVLRPLKSANLIPQLKYRLEILFSSLPNFFNVFILLIFFNILVSVVGMHQYGNSLFNRCRINPEPEEMGVSWMTVPGDNRICTKNGLGIHHCGETETCGNPFDYDIPLENEDNANNALISYGIPNFNNLGNSMLLIMSLVSTDGWSQFMYNFIDVDHPAIGIIYSLIMIVIGNFFLMNLILAVIMDTYVIYQERDIKKKMKHVKTNTIEINEEELNIAVIAPMEEQQELEWVDEVTKPLLEELPEDEDEAATKRSNESQEASEVLEDESVNEEDLSGEEGAELADQPKGQQEKSEQPSAHKVRIGKDLKKLETEKGKPSSSLSVDKHTGQEPLIKIEAPQETKQVKDGKKALTESQIKSNADRAKDMIENEFAGLEMLVSRKLLKQLVRKNQKGGNEVQKNHHRGFVLANILKKMLDKKSEKKIKQDKLLNRAKDNKFFKACLAIVKNRIYSIIMASVIIGNTVVQALDKYPESSITGTLDAISISFSIVYFVELIINICAQGLNLYFQSVYNKFDCIIVLVSMIDVVYYFIFGELNVNSITALRMFRMMRVFKLAKIWRTFRKLLKTMWKTLIDVAAFSIILFLFIYIYSVLGMELFAEKAKFLDDVVVSPDSELGSSIDQNFDSFLQAFTTVFVLLTEDGWSSIFFQHFRAVNNFKSSVFFVSLYIIGPLILLNLFLGILLEDFDEDSLEMELDKQLQMDKEKQMEYLKKEVEKSADELGLKEKQTIRVTSTAKMSDKIQSPQKGLAKQTQVQPMHSITPEAPLSEEMALKEKKLKEDQDKYEKMQKIFEKSTSQLDHCWDSFMKHLNEFFNGQSEKVKLVAANDLKRSQNKAKALLSFMKNNKERQQLKRKLKEEIEVYEMGITNDKKQNQKRKALEDAKKSGSAVAPDEEQDASFDETKTYHRTATQKFKAANQILFDKEVKPEQKSLYLFDENNSLRLFCFKAVRSSKYEWFIILFIVLTSVHLSLSRPTSDPEGYEVRTLYWVDFATTMVFASEFLMKIIAFGFIGCGPQSYLRNPWNLFDFFILVVSLTSINPLINRLQVIKMFRVMRVLRLVSSTYGLRVGLQAIMSAIPSVISVVLIMLLFFIIFGVIGVSFFKGKYYYCWQERAMDMNGYDEVFHLETKWDCFNSGGDWRREYYNFDNIYEAMSTLFIMANLSWSNVMYQGTKVSEIDYERIDGNHPYWIFFFISFIIIGSFFLLNLFVGVVHSSFKRQTDTLGGYNLMTDNQRELVDIHLMVLKSKPVICLKGGNALYNFCLNIIQAEWFEQMIYCSIILNTIILSVKWGSQSITATFSIKVVNYVFSGIFAVEAILKLAVYQARYFKDRWNIFDFMVLLLSISALSLYSASVKLGSAITVIRAFRLQKAIKKYKSLKSLRLIIQTFIASLDPLASIGSLLVLILYVYAIVGVALFGNVKRNGSLTDTINFESFPAAALTLFVVATGDGWTDIRDSCSKPRTLDFDCIEDPTYQDYEESEETVGCGPGISGFFFFNSYYLIMNLILLKLFIAVICQTYEDVKEIDQRWFKEDAIDAFNEIWAEFDNNATGFVVIGEIQNLISQLAKNRLLNKGFQNWKQNDEYQQQLFVGDLNLPVYRNFVDQKVKTVIKRIVEKKNQFGKPTQQWETKVKEDYVYEDNQSGPQEKHDEGEDDERYYVRKRYFITFESCLNCLRRTTKRRKKVAEYQYKYQDLLDYVAQRLTIVNFIYKERGASLKEQVEQMTEDLKEQLEDVGISLDSNEDIDGDADDHLGEDYELKAKLRRMKVSESEIQHEMKKLDSELDELISGGKTENIIVIQDIEEQVLKIEKKNPPPVYNFTSMQHMTFKRALRIRYNFNIKMKIKAQEDRDKGLYPEAQLARESYPDDDIELDRYKQRLRKRSMSYNNQSDYHRTNQDHDTNYDYFPKANIQMLLKLEERISGGAPDSGNHLEASNAFEDDQRGNYGGGLSSERRNQEAPNERSPLSAFFSYQDPKTDQVFSTLAQERGEHRKNQESEESYRYEEDDSAEVMPEGRNQQRR